MNKSFVLALATLAVFTAPSSVSARDYKTIMAPYTEQYGDWKKIRSAMRKRQKNGEIRTGDDWFVLAAMCNIEPPRGPSRIMNFANRSPCKDEVVEYFVKAGMEGTPEGFREAARIIETGEPAYLYASLAFQLSGTDRALADEALTLLENNRLAPELTERAFRQAQGMAQQLRAQGIYTTGFTGAPDSPGGQDGYRSPPPIDRGRSATSSSGNLAWLDFVDPAMCEWNSDADAVFSDSIRFNSAGTRALPNTVRVRGFSAPVTSRLERVNRNRATELDVYVDFEGRWNGLQVLGLTRTFIERSDFVNSFGLRFREPVREVAARLAASGFLVNADGSTRDSSKRRVERWAGPDGGGSVEVIDGAITRIFRRGGETVFLCDRVYEEGSP